LILNTAIPMPPEIPTTAANTITVQAFIVFLSLT